MTMYNKWANKCHVYTYTHIAIYEYQQETNAHIILLYF